MNTRNTRDLNLNAPDVRAPDMGAPDVRALVGALDVSARDAYARAVHGRIVHVHDVHVRLRKQIVRVAMAVAVAAVAFARPDTLSAQRTRTTPPGASRPMDMREQTSLDMWIVQRFRGAQLLPDSGARTPATLAQAGAPRVEAARNTTRRDTVVALHFGPTMWRASISAATPVQLADPSGTISGIAGKVTARRAFRAPRVAGARDSVKEDWRIGWAYLVAIPVRAANASPSGFAGWALAELPARNTAKGATPAVPNSRKAQVETAATGATTIQSAPPAPTPPMH